MELSIVILVDGNTDYVSKLMDELSLQDTIEKTPIFVFNLDRNSSLTEMVDEFSIEYPMLNLRSETISRSFLDINENILDNIESPYTLYISDYVKFSNTHYLKDLVTLMEKKERNLLTPSLKPPISNFKTNMGYWVYNMIHKMIKLKHTIIHSSFFILRTTCIWDYRFPVGLNEDMMHIKIDECKSRDFIIEKKGIKIDNDKFYVNSFKKYIKSIFGILK